MAESKKKKPIKERRSAKRAAKNIQNPLEGDEKKIAILAKK